MSGLVFLMVLNALFTLVFFVLVFRQIIKYNRSFRFPENRHTKLFGFITKEQVLLTYGLFVLAHVFFTFFVIFSL